MIQQWLPQHSDFQRVSTTRVFPVNVRPQLAPATPVIRYVEQRVAQMVIVSEVHAIPPARVPLSERGNAYKHRKVGGQMIQIYLEFAAIDGNAFNHAVESKRLVFPKLHLFQSAINF